MMMTQKDIERADNLNWRGRTFCVIGGDIAISNAKKMAKQIKDTTKLLARFEAVSNRWDDNKIIQPFIDRILELMPGSKYALSYLHGKHTGATSMGPCKAPEGDEIETILWNIGFTKGRGW